ncbi:MAG: GNAT family N-acetyltransferase [Chlamydiia bacterium]|nr:GNAT family N-acetyltransferase [Chlamydiia bacterium]
MLPLPNSSSHVPFDPHKAPPVGHGSPVSVLIPDFSSLAVSSPEKIDHLAQSVFARGSIRSPVPLSVSDFEIQDLTTQQDLKGVKKAIRAWRDIVSDRAGITASAFQECGMESKEEWRMKKVEDQRMKADYFDMVTRVDTSLDKLLSAHKYPQDLTVRHVRTLVDQEGLTHSVVIYSVDPVRGIYVDELLSNGANVPMHSPPSDDGFTIKPVKGVGRALMQSLFNLAQEERLPKVYLKPLTGSLPFYKQIGMDHDVITDHCIKYTALAGAAAE